MRTFNALLPDARAHSPSSVSNRARFARARRR
jgi:hypothetical protein